MKLNKIFLSLIAMLSFIMTACSNSDDYDWATVSGNQVYFSNVLDATSMEISSKASSFEVPIYRVKTDEAITVPLTATLEEGSIFTVPSSVEFKVGEKEAKIVISYDPAKIAFGKYEKVALAVANEEYSTPYGLGNTSFMAGATEWTDWAPYNAAGTATFSYNGFWTGDDAGLKFSIRHNTIETDEYQLRIDQCLYGVDLVMNWNKKTGIVTVPVQSTGYHHASYDEDVMIADYDSYLKATGKENEGGVYGSFDEETGIISLPTVYFISLGVFVDGWEYIYLDGYDRKDVSCSIAYDGKYTDPKDNTSIIATVELGKDVTSANVALVSGELTQESFDQIKAGTYPGLQQVEESGRVLFPTEEMTDGNYTLVVITFAGEEPQNYETASFKYVSSAAPADDNTWQAIYQGAYTYGAKSYTEDGATFYEGTDEVVLYQSVKDPSVFKVSPWAETEKGLIFTMDEDNKIIVDHCETGVEDSMYGTVYVTDLVTFGVVDAGDGFDSAFDPETGVLKFFLAYHIDAGAFCYELDQLQLSAEASARINKARTAKKVAKKHNARSLTLAKPFVHKMVKPMFFL